MAAPGPPPGLSPPHPSSSPPLPPHFLPGRLTRGTGPRYARSFLLKLAGSPLVPAVPDEMPALTEWFGAYEPYTPKAHHPYQHQHHNQQSGPMGSFQQTGRNNRDRGDRGDRGGYHSREDGAAQGGVMGIGMGMGEGKMDGTGYMGRRARDGETREGRYRKTDDSEGGGAQRYDRDRLAPSTSTTNTGSSSRYLTGKNPFGQLSSTGAFRPAGKDLESPTMGKFGLGGRMGREREDRPGGRRRKDDMAGAEDDASGADGWETVPRSPETERKLARQAGTGAGTVADSASDWRRGTAAGPAGLPRRGEGAAGGMRATRAGGAGGMRSNDDGISRRGGGGPSGSFPAWMADDAEPSWMADNDPSPSTSASQPHERKERGKLNFDAFKGSESAAMNIHVVPREGEDSIQAFKREMRERERRAKEREGGEEPSGEGSRDSATVQAQGPPPGLSKVAHTNNDEAEKSKPIPTSMDENDSRRDRDRDEGRTSSTPTTGATPSSPAVQPASRGSSRFARFFDGAAATNKAREAQEKALAAHTAAQANASGGATAGTGAPSSSSAAASSAGLEALFWKTSVSGAEGGAGGAGQGKEPSEADVQGMQKIMAMLRGGGGGAGGGGNNAGEPGSSGPGQREREREVDAKSGGSQQAAAGLMAMLSSSREAEQPQQQQQPGRPSSPHQQRSGSGTAGPPPPPPGLRPPTNSNTNGGGRHSPPTHFNPNAPLPPRAQSPGVAFNEQQQQQQQGRSPYGLAPPHGPPPPGFAPGPGPPTSPGAPGGMLPHFGMDPRMDPRLRPGPPPSAPPGLSPGQHHQQGHGNVNVNGAGYPPSHPHARALPPHIQHQLMGLPPHVQHSILSSGGALPPPPGPPPPPGHPAHHQHYGPPPPGFAPPPMGRSASPFGGSGGGGRSPYPVQHVGPYAQQHQQGGHSPYAGNSGSPGAGPPGMGAMFGGQGGR
ncbi:hypothetical protein BDZ90DRAFT_260365 [Jaminaea rosea]|uniref:Uncharacterized protein n=1 Tax=Jaminaea rosea TaxID=1569628 RepID=A0A316UPP3_9BASI|nr:hypothetical protein BDZ90DRAFT_260365 [Jaminaea rosea]PWN27272.1 hypothetical protein BDZ90DRAFT_260365 [Jaminaea rosea]